MRGFVCVMSITQLKSEPPSPANKSWEGLKRGLAYPAGDHWSKAALFEYDHKSCNEQTDLPDAAEGDRRGKSFNIADSSSAQQPISLAFSILFLPQAKF